MSFEQQSTKTEKLTGAGLFLSNEALRQDLEPLLKHFNIPVTLYKNTRGKTDFLNDLSPAETGALRLIILDLTEQKDPSGLACEMAARCNFGTAIVALGTKNDVALYRQLLSAGVRDYLLHPVPGHVFVQSVEHIFNQSNTQARACTVAFYGTHGGVGAGLLAAGVASHIAGIHGRSVVCADTDSTSPSLGSHLGVDKPGDLSLLLAAGKRLDGTLLRQALRQLHDNLSLLNSFDPMRDTFTDEENAAELLLETLRRQHRFLVWRVAGSSPLSRQVLLSADIIFLVATGNMASAAIAQTMTDWFAHNNPRAVIHQLFNTVSPHQPLAPAMLEKVTERKNKLVIPWKKNLSKDLALNTPLLKPAHSLHREFACISGDIVGVQVNEKKSLRERFGL